MPDCMAPDFLPVALGSVLKTIHKKQNEVLKPYGLSSLHALYLMLLYDNEQGMTMKSLNERIVVDKSNTSRAVASLEEKGYALRRMVDQEGGKWYVYLTEQGKKAARASREGMQRIVEALQGGMSLDEQNVLRSVLEKLFRACEVI